MESLGIDAKLLIGQIVNFLLLLFILSKVLYKPLVKLLEERRQKIADSLDNAKKIEAKLLKTNEESREILAKTETEARRIIDESHKLAQKEKTEIIESAKSQSDRIISSAKAEADSVKNKVVEEAKKEISSVVTMALDKIIKDLPADQKKQLAEKAIKEL